MSKPSDPIRPHPDEPPDHLTRLPVKAPQYRASPVGFQPVRRSRQNFQGRTIIRARRQYALAASHAYPPRQIPKRDSVPVEMIWESCLANDFIGAAGEEILFRGLIFLGLRRLGGTTLALVGSALAFSLVHGANPGASTIWMMRLFAQGLLLAYAVVRTGTLWWSIAYHAGWNWASAPIFGAVGSGYTDQGHLMTLTPSGSFLITGGDVGPEGSIFAFVAVAVATGLLFLTTRSKEKGVRLLS